MTHALFHALIMTDVAACCPRKDPTEEGNTPSLLLRPACLVTVSDSPAQVCAPTVSHSRFDVLERAQRCGVSPK